MVISQISLAVLQILLIWNSLPLISKTFSIFFLRDPPWYFLWIHVKCCLKLFILSALMPHSFLIPWLALSFCQRSSLTLNSVAAIAPVFSLHLAEQCSWLLTPRGVCHKGGGRPCWQSSFLYVLPLLLPAAHSTSRVAGIAISPVSKPCYWDSFCPTDLSCFFSQMSTISFYSPLLGTAQTISCISTIVTEFKCSSTGLLGLMQSSGVDQTSFSVSSNVSWLSEFLQHSLTVLRLVCTHRTHSASLQLHFQPTRIL